MDVGNGMEADSGSWTFDIPSSEAFNIHISKSVPSYLASHDIIIDISEYFVNDHSKIVDVGCSLGLLLNKLAIKHEHKRGITYTGLEKSPVMAENAKSNVHPGVHIKNLDALDYDYSSVSYAVLHYVLQFLTYQDRIKLCEKIYMGLNEVAAIIVFEKVRSHDPEIYDMLLSCYDEFKSRSGFSSEQIISKRQTLRGVLKPLTTEENMSFLKQIGFRSVTLIQKHLLFEGYLAIK